MRTACGPTRLEPRSLIECSFRTLFTSSDVRHLLTSGTSHTIIAIAAILVVIGTGVAGQAVTQPALRAAFLYNFAKFTEWPDDTAAAGALTLCVLDDGAVEVALTELVGTSLINGRSVTVSRGASGTRLRTCHILYIGETDTPRATILDEVEKVPVLTVSNGDEFVRTGGMIGLFVEEGRMRFAINPDAAQRAGVRLSSRLLQLAKIHRDDQP